MMAPINQFQFGGHCIAALFVAGTPVYALADGMVHWAGDEPGSAEVHSGLLTAILSSDRSAILTGGEDGRVCQIDKFGRTTELACVPRKWISAVASGNAGAFAYGAGRTVWFNDGAGGERSFQHASTVEDITFSPDGKRIVVARYNGVSIHDLAADEPSSELAWKSMNTGVTFSPDGRFLLARMRESGFHGWRVADGQHMRMIGYASSISDWSWSAHGEWLATSGAHAAIVWPFEGDDGPMGKTPLELGARDDSTVTAVACHPARRAVAIGYADGVIQLADINSDRCSGLKPAGDGEVTSLAWDVTGTRLAFGCDTGVCGLIDTQAL